MGAVCAHGPAAGALKGEELEEICNCDNREEDVSNFNRDEALRFENAKLRAENAGLRQQLESNNDVEAIQVNALLELMWPHISSFMLDKMVHIMDTQIQDMLPTYLKGRVAFKREACKLGMAPPTIRCLNIRGAKQDTVDGTDQVVTLAMHIHWDGECTVNLDVAGVGMGIRNIAIDGVWFVELVGLMNEVPFCRGVRCFFLNPPSLSFEWAGVVSVLNKRFVHQSIMDVILNSFSEYVVLPNRVGFALLPGADVFRIKAPRPEGILRLVVKSAEDLLAKDVSLASSLRASVHARHPKLVANASDPYFKLRCGAEVLTSEVQKQTVNPTYDFVAHLLIAQAASQHVSLTFFDKDFASTAEYLGTCQIPVHRLIAWGEEERLVELSDENGDVGCSGRVRLSAEWRPIVLEPPAPVPGEGPRVEPCYLFVGVYEAMHVPRSEHCLRGQKVHLWLVADCTRLVPRSRPSPQRGHKVQERADTAASGRQRGARAAGSPGAQDLHVEQAFGFLVEDPQASKLTLRLMRRLPHSRDEELGHCGFDVAELLSADHHTSQQVIELGGTGIALKLRLQLRFLGKASSDLA